MGEDYGWTVEGAKASPLKLRNDWPTLRENIQNYIKGINFGYKKKLKEIDVDYINARALFKDPNTVAFEL
jgi:ribosomal protein L6P/L9E